MDSQFVAHDVPVESLPPALRAGLSLEMVRPDQRVVAFPCSLPDVDPTLTHARNLVTGDTTVLARYEGDAHLTSWLPDGSGFVMTGGYVVRGGDYARALLLADSAGRVLETLARDGGEYDGAVVSPSGDRILVSRAGQGGREMRLMRLDGTIEGTLGWCNGSAACSPRGDRVACGGDSAGVLLLGDARPASTPSPWWTT